LGRDERSSKWDLFDIQVVSIALLINLVEQDAKNRILISQIVVGAHDSQGVLAIEFLTKLFIDLYSRSEEENNENTVMQGYIAVLLGCLIIENQQNKATIQQLFPENNLKRLGQTVQQFIEFQLDNDVLPEENIASFLQILKTLDSNTNSIQFLTSS